MADLGTMMQQLQMMLAQQQPQPPQQQQPPLPTTPQQLGQQAQPQMASGSEVELCNMDGSLDVLPFGLVRM